MHLLTEEGAAAKASKVNSESWGGSCHVVVYAATQYGIK